MSRPGSFAGRAAGRVVVVSPHLDDAVLSLGATIAEAASLGAHVVVLTVLGCDPDSDAPTRGWDARAGFATEAEAARARRVEDEAACAVIGASARWLRFGSVDYARHGDESDVLEQVRSALAGAEVALLPGSPLTHPDHAWLTRQLVGSDLPVARLGFYAEQPYSVRAGGRHGVTTPGWLEDRLGGRIGFERRRGGARGWLAKRSAIRCYRSQLPLLGLAGRARLERHLAAELRAGGEAVGWPAGGAAR